MSRTPPPPLLQCHRGRTQGRGGARTPPPTCRLNVRWCGPPLALCVGGSGVRGVRCSPKAGGRTLGCGDTPPPPAKGVRRGLRIAGCGRWGAKGMRCPPPNGSPPPSQAGVRAGGVRVSPPHPSPGEGGVQAAGVLGIKGCFPPPNKFGGGSPVPPSPWRSKASKARRAAPGKPCRAGTARYGTARRAAPPPPWPGPPPGTGGGPVTAPPRYRVPAFREGCSLPTPPKSSSPPPQLNQLSFACPGRAGEQAWPSSRGGFGVILPFKIFF